MAEETKESKEKTKPVESEVEVKKAETTTETEKKVETTVPAESATTEPAKKNSKPKSKAFLFGIIIVVLILVIGGGAGAYFGYVKPNQPKAIVKAALSNALVLNKQRSFNVTAQFTAKDSDTDLEFNDFSIEGGIDNESNIRADVSIDSNIFNINASMIVRLNDQELYIKLDNLDSIFSAIPDAMSYPEISNFVSTLSDNWIRLSVGDLEDAGFVTSNQADKASECVDAYADFVKNSSSDLQKQFDNLYSQADFATMSKVGAEVIDGQKMTKYAVAINQARLKVFVTGLSNQLRGSTKQLADKCGFEQAVSTVEGGSSSDSASNTSNVDLKNLFVWIDSNKQIGQLEVTLGDDEMDIVLTASFGTEKVDTDQPTDYTTITELLQDPTFTDMLGGILSGGL